MSPLIWDKTLSPFTSIGESKFYESDATVIELTGLPIELWRAVFSNLSERRHQHDVLLVCRCFRDLGKIVFKKIIYSQQSLITAMKMGSVATVKNLFSYETFLSDPNSVPLAESCGAITSLRNHGQIDEINKIIENRKLEIQYKLDTFFELLKEKGIIDEHGYIVLNSEPLRPNFSVGDFQSFLEFYNQTIAFEMDIGEPFRHRLDCLKSDQLEQFEKKSGVNLYRDQVFGGSFQLKNLITHLVEHGAKNVCLSGSFLKTILPCCFTNVFIQLVPIVQSKEVLQLINLLEPDKQEIDITIYASTYDDIFALSEQIGGFLRKCLGINDENLGRVIVGYSTNYRITEARGRVGEDFVFIRFATCNYEFNFFIVEDYKPKNLITEDGLSISLLQFPPVMCWNERTWQAILDSVCKIVHPILDKRELSPGMLKRLATLIQDKGYRCFDEEIIQLCKAELRK